MSDIDKPDVPNVTLTIRLLMTGKEVGSIIGKGGEIIHSIREESGAKIFISDGSVPERIITITGHTDTIFKSFDLICKKLEDDGSNKLDSAPSKGGNVTLKLIVPASQCGSLIGKGGSKIKEIREITGASVLVASEMLPNSTERTVTISGNHLAISQCIYQICSVMMESPAKGTTIPYTPKSNGLGGAFLGMAGNARMGRGQENPLASLLGLGGGASTLAAIATLAGSHIRERRGDRDEGRGATNTQTYEMSIPNDMIGCIIGKGGSKIAEIRKLSGAMIRISKSDEIGSGRGEKSQDSEEGSERHISISGNSDSVALAKSLINMSLDLHKARLEDRNNSDRSGGPSNSLGVDMGPNLGLAQLLAKPEALTTALTTLASLSTLGGLGGGLLGGLGGGGFSGRPRGGYGGNSGSRNRDDDKGRDSKRSKFAPY